MKKVKECFLITVNQPSVLTPRIYVVYESERPTLDRLKCIGADINILRGDTFVIDKVSRILGSSVNAQWLRD